jgi:hypothetical protein
MYCLDPEPEPELKLLKSPVLLTELSATLSYAQFA